MIREERSVRRRSVLSARGAKSAQDRRNGRVARRNEECRKNEKRKSSKGKRSVCRKNGMTVEERNRYVNEWCRDRDHRGNDEYDRRGRSGGYSSTYYRDRSSYHTFRSDSEEDDDRWRYSSISVVLVFSKELFCRHIMAMGVYRHMF